MSKKIDSHFQTVDSILFAALQKIGEIPPVTKKGNSADHFTELAASIISQQLSTKVADVIWTRFVHLFPEGKEWAKGQPEPSLSPTKVLKVPDQLMRDQGLSWAKIKYIKDLAQKVVDKEIDLEHLDTLPDEEVITELVKVKGIGRWTAEMFLMFGLARPDIFSTGDLGLKRAIQKLYSLETEPDELKLLELSQKWSPYRTFAARILWRSLDNETK
ncbi:MAG: DNA-3-methyladenine glycosylase [Candidatus Woesebacteria bacterium]